jgi:hypothetical protein
MPIEETKMNTVLSNTRNANLYLIAALAIIAVVLLTFTVVPSIAMRGPAVIPVTGSENAYIQFLHGEKAVYANPAGLNEALSTYHIGEQAIYASVVDASSALSIYLVGEKALYTSPDAANALSAWSVGEKSIAGSASLESALSAWRQGEKEAK